MSAWNTSNSNMHTSILGLQICKAYLTYRRI
uniref:Uncharacterized protein n=1 Tax=Rhizophora mucronata TaxID=61149 RepID=A0A2P2PH72_RHIMU